MNEHTVKSFTEQLETLAGGVAQMGGLAETQLANAIEAIAKRDSRLAETAVSTDQRVDGLQHEVEHQALKLLALRQPLAVDLRTTLAAIKIANELERIGDLAVNLAQRVITLREMPGAQLPDELAPMAAAVRAMVSKSLGALIFRNADMAALVLESDDVVDKYRDTIFEKLMENMTQQASLVSSGMQFVLATRHLERIADHATNIAEDIIFWVRGLDVRHGRGLVVSSEMQASDTEEVVRITDNSHPLHPAVKVIGDTQPA